MNRPPKAVSDIVSAEKRASGRPHAKKILFICGSMNQTTQMHQIARQLPEFEHYFTPYYAVGPLEWFRRLGLLEFTILGNKSAGRTLDYFAEHSLNVDVRGMSGNQHRRRCGCRPYDLVLTCADLIIPRNIRRSPIILVQEGMTDPETWVYRVAHHARILPRWVASTSMMGLSGWYDRFCVASEAYRQLFIRKGAPGHKIVVTGIPNFDDCAKFSNNDFPHHDYFLVCTSDLRETFLPENRKKFIKQAIELANGRPMFFKLHPNENWQRARKEIEEYAPGSLILTSGNTDHIIANCSALLTHYSSTVYVALALGKEVHCDLNVEELKRLLPLQNASAAQNIAHVCREVIAESGVRVDRVSTRSSLTGLKPGPHGPRVLICIQARMSSSRLPGKVLMPLARAPLLQRMIERVQSARVEAEIVVLTSTEREDGVIKELCRQIQVECFAGHLTDLLDRHYQAAREYGADVIAKIPSDCPMIDPAIIEQVFDRFNQGPFDYVSNLHPASHPDGNDVEVFTFKTLEEAWLEARQDFEREHTTPFIWERPERYQIGNVRYQSGDYSMSHRWTIDYPEDYDFISSVYERLWRPERPIFSMEDVLMLLHEHPEIATINKQYAGVNWYRNHLADLHTIAPDQTRILKQEAL